MSSLARDSGPPPEPEPAPEPAFIRSPRDRQDDEALRVLLYLAALVEVDADLSTTREAIAQARRALADAPIGGGNEGNEKEVAIVARAASRIGLQVKVGMWSVADLARGAAGTALPLIARGHAGGWLAVRERRGARLLVSMIDEPRARPTPARALAERLGVAPDERVAWVMADPEAPLESLKAASGDGHGGGGHDHGDGDGGGHAHPTPARRLLSLLRAERDDLWVSLVYAVGVGVLSLAIPIAVQALVNSVAFGALVQPIVVLAVLVFIGLGLAGIMRVLQTKVIELIQQRIFARVSVDLAHRLPRVKMEAFDREHGPELVNRFFDVLTVQKSAATLLIDGISVVLQTAIGMLVLAFYHPALLAFDVVLVLGILVVVVTLGRGATDTTLAESRAKYAVAAWLEEMARHPVLFKSAAGSAFAALRAEELTRRYLLSRRAHFRVVLGQTIGSLSLQAIASAALLGIGGWLVIQRELTLGQLVAAELIVSAVVAGVSKFGKYLESYYDLLSAMDKLGHLVDLPLERGGDERTRAATGGARVALRGVAYAHEGARPIFEQLSLDVAASARVYLSGDSGTGKSTVLDLIYGLRRAARGRVEIDGADLRDLDLQSLRTDIALVRGTEIFEGTIAENVQLGRAWIAPSEVRAALEAVGLWDELAHLPEGTSARMATGGAPLSASQARRICLARAIAGRPRVLLIDDVIDSLDASDLDRVTAALLDPRAPWTLICASAQAAPPRPGFMNLRLVGGDVVHGGDPGA